MEPVRLRLGELLVDAQIISKEQLSAVLERQEQDGRRLGTLLVEQGLVNETQLTQILSQQLAVPWVSLYHVDFSKRLLNLIPADVAHRFSLVPIYARNVKGQGETLYVAMDDPTNVEALRECSEWSGLPTRAMIASPSDIRTAIRTYYPKDDDQQADEERASEKSPESAAETTSSDDSAVGSVSSSDDSVVDAGTPKDDGGEDAEQAGDMTAIASQGREGEAEHSAEGSIEADKSPEASGTNVQTPASSSEDEQETSSEVSAEDTDGEEQEPAPDAAQESKDEPGPEPEAAQDETTGAEQDEQVEQVSKDAPDAKESSSRLDDSHGHEAEAAAQGDEDDSAMSDSGPQQPVPFLLGTPTLRPPSGVAPSPGEGDGTRPAMDSVPPDPGAHEVDIPLAYEDAGVPAELKDGDEGASEHGMLTPEDSAGEEDDVVVEVEGEMTLDDLLSKRKKTAGKAGGVMLTLLDGTTISLPVGKRGKAPRTLSRDLNKQTEASTQARSTEEQTPADDRAAAHDMSDISAEGIMTALAAAAHGVSPSGALRPHVQWQAISVVLLRLLLKHGVISEEELIEELRKV